MMIYPDISWTWENEENNPIKEQLIKEYKEKIAYYVLKIPRDDEASEYARYQYRCIEFCRDLEQIIRDIRHKIMNIEAAKK